LHNLLIANKPFKLSSTYTKEIQNIVKIMVYKKSQCCKFILMSFAIIGEVNMDGLLLLICIILVVIIGYLIFEIINANTKIGYYKKLDKWRKTKHQEW
jgi:hypothetical protein